MAVMDMSRVHGTEPPGRREPAADHPPRYSSDLDEGDPRAWGLYQELDLGEQIKVEFIEGNIVVRGAASLRHARLITWLIDCLRQRCEEQGWDRVSDCHLELPAPARGIRPDLLVIRDPDVLDPDEGGLDPEHVLLAAEVVSPSTTRDDRELKRLSCARCGIPLYLLIDRCAERPAISVFSDPSQDGYQTTGTVRMGDGGGQLYLPAPFDLTLDATTVPMR
jgi:Uma2 family endonuclease